MINKDSLSLKKCIYIISVQFYLDMGALDDHRLSGTGLFHPEILLTLSVHPLRKCFFVYHQRSNI